MFGMWCADFGVLQMMKRMTMIGRWDASYGRAGERRCVFDMTDCHGEMGWMRGVLYEGLLPNER
jgi:hypothetical protein